MSKELDIMIDSKGDLVDGNHLDSSAKLQPGALLVWPFLHVEEDSILLSMILTSK